MADRFDTTRWSLIVHAGADSRDALDALCRAYRPPVLAYVRARHGREEAEDLTQAFFAHLLEHRLAARADRARGRFRAFLLTALRNFLASEHARATALRRGGGQESVCLDEVDPGSDAGPEREFEREWAQTVLRLAMQRLAREAADSGKAALFARLQPFALEIPGDADYDAVGAELGLRRNTVAVAVHRLRARLQELVHEVVADTVSDGDAAEMEVRRLRRVLTGDATTA